jgi:hypothetical protein
VEAVLVSKTRTACPLGQLNSIANNIPSGAGKISNSPQLGGIEKGISLIG